MSRSTTLVLTVTQRVYILDRLWHKKRLIKAYLNIKQLCYLVLQLYSRDSLISLLSILIDLDLLLRNLVRVLSSGDLTNLGWSTWFLLLRNLVLLLSLYLNRSSLRGIRVLLLRNLILILCLCLDWSNLRCRRILLLRNKIIFRGLCLILNYFWWCSNNILYRNCRGCVGILLILAHVLSVVDYF